MALKAILFTAGTALFLSCSSGAQQRAKIAPIPNGVELASSNSTASGHSILDVEILEDGVARVHVELDGKSTPRTLVMDPHPKLRPPSAVRSSEHDGVYTLSSPGITVRVIEMRPFTLTFLDAAGRQLLESQDPFREAANAGVTMLHAAGDTRYGIHGLGRDDTSVGLTRNDGGKVAAGVQGDSGAPFVFSTRYGLLVDSDGGEFTAAPGSSTFAKTWKDIPLFIHGGSIVATQPIEQYVGQNPVTELTLDVFPSAADQATFLAYDDDGQTYKCEQGDCLRQQIGAVQNSGETMLTIAPATGAYASPLRTYLIRIHTVARHVSIDGQWLPHSQQQEQLAGSAPNWTLANDRFGPVVLLRVSAGKRTATVIDLR